jgi:pimeloyl-ACP methyl ester carboxylesterase
MPFETNQPQQQIHEAEVRMRTPQAALDGTLALPGTERRGIIVFAHGSGSSRFSSRNRFVAAHLQRQRLATLLFDLLTPEEEKIDQLTGHLRFDIDLLARRLIDVVTWLDQHDAIRGETRGLPIGYFGASTGGGAALVAAAQQHARISAVVSRGGRPDLAGEEALSLVRAPTLLIVGGNDEPVIEMNEWAIRHLRCEKKMVIVPNATHLFEEPGALEQVAQLAGEWFAEHLPEEVKTRPIIEQAEQRPPLHGA